MQVYHYGAMEARWSTSLQETAAQVWGWRHSEEAVLNCSAKDRGSVAATLPEV